MCTKKDQTSAKILLLYFLCRQLSPADSPSHLGVVYLWCHTSLIAYDLITFYCLVGRARCGLTFAKPHHLPAQEVLTAAAHFSSFQTDSPPITKLEAPTAQNLQIPPIKFAALKVRLHPNTQQGWSPGANAVHQPIMTQPYRWPCAGRSRGQSTITALVLHFGGCWWWRWRGCGAAMITHTLHGRAGWVPLPGNRLHHHGHYLPLQRLPHKTERAVTKREKRCPYNQPGRKNK